MAAFIVIVVDLVVSAPHVFEFFAAFTARLLPDLHARVGQMVNVVVSHDQAPDISREEEHAVSVMATAAGGPIVPDGNVYALFFRRGTIKSCTVDAEREFKAESRLDMAADSRDAKSRARTPWGR